MRNRVNVGNFLGVSGYTIRFNRYIRPDENKLVKNVQLNSMDLSVHNYRVLVCAMNQIGSH